MTETTTEARRTRAGADFLDWWQGREYVTVTLDFAEVSVALIEREARNALRAELRAKVQDIPHHAGGYLVGWWVPEVSVLDLIGEDES